MNLSRHPPAFVAQCLERFKAALQSRGMDRGMRAEKKSDSEASLLIYDTIGEDWWTGGGVKAEDVAAKLDELKGVAKLEVFINSPGGDVFEGKTIYNQLRRFGAAEKIVHIDGIAASAASLIAMAGTKIITEPGGTWLVHRVASGAYGFEEVLRARADEIATESVSIRGIYEQRTGKSPAEWDAWMREDKIIDAATAKARGLTDEISEVEQKRADEAAAAAARVPVPRSKTPAELVASARAMRDEIRTKFPAASRGPQQPGQPGETKPSEPGNRQEQKK